MSAKVYITVDTEEDTWSEWSSTDNPVENVSSIPELQKLFERYGAVPTYLVNYPVVTDPGACGIIKRILETGRCGIGTHCHPWNTPPFAEDINASNTMLCNLPYDLISSKIENVHRKITASLGVEPVCFRAGRWGFSSDVARCIKDLGYRIDTSVVPLWNWSHEHGPDFSDAPYSPYRFDPEEILTEDPEGTLLEVPVTVGFIQRDFFKSAGFRRAIMNSALSGLHILGLLDRLKILNFRLLSPEVCSRSEIITISRNVLRAGHPHLNMIFHSASLLPGKSEFVKNEGDLEKFMRIIETFLEFCVDAGLSFSPLGGAMEGMDG